MSQRICTVRLAQNSKTLWHWYRYHYSYNTGLQAQGVLYSQLGLQDEGCVLLDPNKLSDDGTVALITVSMMSFALHLYICLGQFHGAVSHLRS